jgi:hypothetical protein
MGTSSARKAPAGKFWRAAKTAASRFASGKETSPPLAQEVVARYLNALESHNPEPSSGMRSLLGDIVRAAATLGNFYHLWKQEGWEAALESLGLNPVTLQSREAVMPALLDRLAGPGAGLNEAAARAALIDHLDPVLSAGEHPAQTKGPSDPYCPPGISGLLEFLGLALYRKLLSDLGDPLEFQAPSITQGLQRQEEIKSHILANLATAVIPDGTLSLEQTATLLDRITTHLGGRHER